MSSPPPDTVQPAAPGAPVTAAGGTRRRAGNAMGRARAGILAGARRSLAEAGTRGLTMSGVADRGGVAKATVYNHFRSRDELVAGLVVDTVERLASDAAAAPDLESALAGAAGSAARLPELRGAVGHDAAVVAGLVRPGDGVGWVAARTAVAQVMADHGVEASPERVEVVLRWVSAVAVADPDPGAVAAEARVLAAGLLHGSPEGD